MTDSSSGSPGDVPHVTPGKRLLVVRLSALGDVIHTIPAVMLLREHFEVAWVVESPYRELVELVANVRPIPVSLKRWSGPAIAAARRAVRGHDVAVDFQGLIKSAIVARASAASVRYGFAADQVKERPAAWFTNRHVAVDPSLHVVEWNLALARRVLADHGLEKQTSSDVREAFQRYALRSGIGNGAIVLLPGAGREEKLWPVDRLQEVARHFGDRALAVWGPGEEERARAIGCRVAPKTSIRELAGVLSEADLVIGGDTGPLHLAAALGTPVVGLYGPTSEKRNGPFGQTHRTVSAFGEEGRMDAIVVSAVLTQAERTLGESPSHQDRHVP